MQIYQNARRNFLSNIAILSLATALKPSIKNINDITNGNADLKSKWKSFWKNSGGYEIDMLLQNDANLPTIKGHIYQPGKVISFPKENILAYPTWIFWNNNPKTPADVVIILFDKSSLQKAYTLNRYEIDVLEKLSKEYPGDALLTACINNLKSKTENVASLLKSEIVIKKRTRLHKVCYYKNQQLELNKKFIYNV